MDYRVFRITLGIICVVGFIWWYRAETGQGITGVEVLERGTSTEGTHEYVAFRTYGPGEEFWYLAVMTSEHPIFMERQYHVLRLKGVHTIGLRWLGDAELEVTLPPELGDPEALEKREVSGAVKVRYRGADQ